MKKISTVILLTTFLSTSLAFAHESNSSCRAIVKACKAAGYERKSEEKKFWKDCMKPLLLGKTVKNVKLDDNVIKNCREKKIEEMQKDLKALQDMN